MGGGLGRSPPFDNIYIPNAVLLYRPMTAEEDCELVIPCSVSQGSAGAAVGLPAAAGPGVTGVKEHFVCEPMVDAGAAW